MSYLMESHREGARLLAQEQANPSRERLRAAGLCPGMRVLDAGCGAGATLPAMLELVGATGSVVGLDPSAERLADARHLVVDAPNVSLATGALPHTGLPPASFDFVFSQYVFEYLREPAAALSELVRLTRPGGRVVVVDMDGLGSQSWPEPPLVTQGRTPFLQALEKTGFDLHIGRKLYSLFFAAGLTDLAVRIDPLYVVAGAADERLLADWRQRFDVLRPVAAAEFRSEDAYAAFVNAYLDLLRDPGALKYAVIVTTGGTRG